MARLRALCLALVFVSVASAARTDPPPPPAGGRLRIVAFGSSSTQGIGATTRSAAYPAQLALLLSRSMPKGREVAVLNRGIGGDDAAAMALRLQKDVIAQRPHLVIWQTGSNDPMTHNPLPKFERETREALAVMKAAGIEVILMEPQWAPALEKIATSNRYRDAVRKIGTELHVPVVRRSDLMRQWIKRGLMTQAQMMSPDGLHMGDRGYAALAGSVAEEVLKTRAFSRRAATEVADALRGVRS